LRSNASVYIRQVLQAELTPLCHNQSRIHELSTYLMLSKSEDVARVTRTARGEISRLDLMDRLQTYLPASIMLPPRRLMTLLSQASEFQVLRTLHIHTRSSFVIGFDVIVIRYTLKT
jgi:hypothetical protein